MHGLVSYLFIKLKFIRLKETMSVAIYGYIKVDIEDKSSNKIDVWRWWMKCDDTESILNFLSLKFQIGTTSLITFYHLH